MWGKETSRHECRSLFEVKFGAQNADMLEALEESQQVK